MAKRGVSGAIMRGLGAKDHALTVVDKKVLAPHFVQVRMTSPTLSTIWTPGPLPGCASGSPVKEVTSTNAATPSRTPIGAPASSTSTSSCMNPPGQVLPGPNVPGPVTLCRR